MLFSINQNTMSELSRALLEKNIIISYTNYYFNKILSYPEIEIYPFYYNATFGRTFLIF